MVVLQNYSGVRTDPSNKNRKIIFKKQIIGREKTVFLRKKLTFFAVSDIQKYIKG